MTAPPEHLRHVVALRPLRGRRAAVVVCADDPADYEACRDELFALDAQLVATGFVVGRIVGADDDGRTPAAQRP